MPPEHTNYFKTSLSLCLSLPSSFVHSLYLSLSFQRHTTILKQKIFDTIYQVKTGRREQNFSV
jgi:hypothetical protein